MKIYNLKDKLNYLDEVANLEYEEWANNKEENKSERIEIKKEKICNAFNNKFFCKLILIDNDDLIGFISIFPNDCEEEMELTPWYATMYVKEKYRNNGYSRILNDAILNIIISPMTNNLPIDNDLYEKTIRRFLLSCGYDNEVGINYSKHKIRW